MTLYSYSVPGGLAYAPNQEPSLSLAVPIDYISGLNVQPPTQSNLIY